MLKLRGDIRRFVLDANSPLLKSRFKFDEWDDDAVVRLPLGAY